MNIPETESDIIFFLCWNSRSMERQRHIWQRLRQGFPRQRNILRSRAAWFWASFRKVRNITLLKNFLWSLRSFRFMHYNRRWNSWQADGRIWSAVHYEKVLELYETADWKTDQPSLSHRKTRRDYEGVRL